MGSWINMIGERVVQRLRNPAPQITAVVQATERFGVGDVAILKGFNPWKGCIKVGKPYTVLLVGSYWIKLQAENGSFGYFNHNPFVKVDGRLMPNRDAFALEYEEVMTAQDIISQL